MKKALFIIILLFSSCFQIACFQAAFAATDEGYGEDQTALGQFVDSFENSNNITVIEDLIVNTTLECVELSYSGAIPILENFTEYTEVDVVADRIQRTDYHIDHKAYRNEITYLYEDYGVNYFTDFIHEFQARSDFSQVLSNGIVWMVANDLGDAVGLWSGGKTYLCLDFHRGSTFRQIILREAFGSTWYSDFMNNPNINTWYYFTIEKSGTAFTCEIYSDSARLNLIDTLSITLQSDHSFRYVYGCNTFNVGTTPFMNTDIENLDIGRVSGGFENDGYFISDDYLNDTVCNGTSLALMVNASIPTNTDIQVQFSEDNATWGDWEGIPLDSNILSGGFETIDLRYLNYTDIYVMFNFSTTDSLITPRLYQTRLISTIGNQTGGAVVGPSGGGAIGLIMLILICSPLIVLVVWRSKRR